MLRFNNEKLQEKKKKKNTNNRYGKPIMSVCQQKNLIVLSRQDRHRSIQIFADIASKQKRN